MTTEELRKEVLRAIVDERGGCDGYENAEWCWSRGPESACVCVKATERVMALVREAGS